LFNLLAILIIRYIYVFFNTKIQIFFLFYRDFTRKAQKNKKVKLNLKYLLTKGAKYGIIMEYFTKVKR